MFPAQLAVSALVWAATVYALSRRRGLLLSWMAKAPRGRRTLLALGLLAASVALLAFGMAAMALGGLTTAGLTWWAWPTITLVGSAFVILQTAALVPLMLNAAQPVTRENGRSSDRVDVERP